MNYFLVSISNRVNLELCIKYALAGFTNSINGLWTFLEIKEGDYVSFLYGARVFNLYKVIKKEAFKNAEKLPPWPPVTFSMSGKTYYFPFRLNLRPVRKFNEPMVRPEFAYVAENLLLRGGYRKTHFQADMLTFNYASQMGQLYDDVVQKLELNDAEVFLPKLCFNKKLASPPQIFYFQELILQTLIRDYLSQKSKLKKFFDYIGKLNYKAEDFEILGEKAFSEGHVDILIKDIYPEEQTRKIVVEIKKRETKKEDLFQLKNYMNEIKEECTAGVLIASKLTRNTFLMAKQLDIILLTYSFKELDKDNFYSYDELLERISLCTPEGDII
jgi:hypothetical protein